MFNTEEKHHGKTYTAGICLLKMYINGIAGQKLQNRKKKKISWQKNMNFNECESYD